MEDNRILFTEAMKKDYTILIPQMAPFHFDLLASTLNSFGYRAEVLKNENSNIANEGNRYVHNDTCVPAIYVIGQFIDAIKSGKYDVHKIALIITQTGGGCRASNYIHLLRSALTKAGYDFIPVISLNAAGLEKNPGFKVNGYLIKKLVQCIVLGDLMMQLYNETIPYEKEKGQVKKLSQYWLNYLAQEFNDHKIISNTRMLNDAKKMIDEFNRIEVIDIKKPKIGIVGEIYVKYSPLGNNNLENFLIEEGCEVVTLGMIDFILYTFESVSYDIKQFGGSKTKGMVFNAIAQYVEKPRKSINKLLAGTRYRQSIAFKDLKELATPFIGYGTHVGEGWLLTAEIIELINNDVKNIITTQPFGCLPNHIVARGMFKSIKEAFPEANLASVDYDTSSSRINQENRIKLLVLNAKEKLQKALL
jgi:predicted nucleotide-binding protein (sugar kinase/HSP70/actin superfamily)